MWTPKLRQCGWAWVSVHWSYMRPNFGKPGLSHKMLFRVIRCFMLVTVILSILSFVDNHEEQSLSFHLVHIRSLHKLYFQSCKCLYTSFRDFFPCVIRTQYNVLPWLPFCTQRRLPLKKIKQGSRHLLTTERHRLKFMIAQSCPPLAATAKHHLFLLLFACSYHGLLTEIYGPTHINNWTTKNTFYSEQCFFKPFALAFIWRLSYHSTQQR